MLLQTHYPAQELDIHPSYDLTEYGVHTSPKREHETKSRSIEAE